MDNMGELINKFIDNLTPTDKTKKIGIGMKFSDGVEYLNNRSSTSTGGGTKDK